MTSAAATLGWTTSVLARSSVPGYWWIILAVVVITPAYFLLSRPRKKRNDSKWKG